MSRPDSADQQARETICTRLDGPLFVEAGAGTGKTTALVDRVVATVTSGAATLDRIVAITFTEAAAEELRQRLRLAFESVAERYEDAYVPSPTGMSRQANQDARRPPVDHPASMDDAAISTIHSFARRILNERCLEAGVPPGFEVLDDAADQADFDLRYRRFLKSLLDDPTADWMLERGFLTGLGLHHIQTLAWALHQNWDRVSPGEYAPPGNPAAGTDGGQPDGGQPDGGTGAHPRPSCLASTPIDVAPLVDALEKACSYVGSCTDEDDRLHARLALSEQALARVVNVTSLDHGMSDRELLQTLMELPDLSAGRIGNKKNWTCDIDEVRSACTAAENQCRAILDAVRQEVLADLIARCSAFVSELARARQDEGRLSFHDLLVLAHRLLSDHASVRTSLRERYRRIFVDEFQDTDALQVAIVRLLDPESESRLFAVGDPRQSIYRFRSADLAMYTEVRDTFPADARLSLSENHRSVPGILAWINAVFAEMFQARGPGQVDHLDLLGTREPIVSKPPVVVFGGPHDGLRAAEVRGHAARDIAYAARSIVNQHWQVSDGSATRDARLADIAVLMPTRRSLRALVSAFDEADIPYRLEGATLIWASQEVRDLMLVLRAVDDRSDHVALLGALRSPMLACSDHDLFAWHIGGGTLDLQPGQAEAGASDPVGRALSMLYELHQQRVLLEPSALVELAVRRLRCFEIAAFSRRPRDRWNGIRWVLDAARRFDEGGGTLGDFLEWADLQASSTGNAGGVGPPDPDDDAVRLMTVHGAKGLEFPVVILAGLDSTGSNSSPAVIWDAEGKLQVNLKPFESEGFEAARALEAQEQDLEADRLLYVAATRARDYLLVSLHHRASSSSGSAKSPAAKLHAAREKLTADQPSFAALEEDWGSPSCDQECDSLVDTPSASSNGEEGLSGTDESLSDQGAETETAEWRLRRAQLLRSSAREPVMSATAVAASVRSEHATSSGDAPRRRDRLRSATIPAGMGGASRDQSLGIGRAVHQVLAGLDLGIACADPDGRLVSELASRVAASHGVDAEVVMAMVSGALRSPTVMLAAGHRHFQEMPVTAALPTMGSLLLEGVVDLLVDLGEGPNEAGHAATERRPGRLVIADFKTAEALATQSPTSPADPAGRKPADPAGRKPASPSAQMSAEHRLQLASYALAIESVTGMAVTRAVIILLGGDACEELEVEDLDQAMGEAAGALASGLSATIPTG